MGIVTGLKAMNKDREDSSFDDSPKAKWFSIKDGDSAKIRFLQELDVDSPNYNEKAGLAFIAVEHANPDKYQRKALCSIEDQGRCFGCEQHKLDPKAKWGQKRRFYANVLAQGKEGLEVFILSQGLGDKAITPTVLDYATEVGSITNTFWSVKRTGTGVSDTSYTAFPLPLKEDTPALDFSKLELFDLFTTAVRDIPYEEQEAFYFGIVNEESKPEEKKTASNFDW